MCNWVGGFGFGLDIGVHNFDFRIRIGYGVYEKTFGSNSIEKFPYPYTTATVVIRDDHGAGVTEWTPAGICISGRSRSQH